MNLQEMLWNRKQSTKYKIMKYVSILVGTLTMPLDVYIGFMLAEEKFLIAFPLIAVIMVIAIIDSCMWSWVLEEMGKEKIKLGIKNGKKISKKNK